MLKKMPHKSNPPRPQGPVGTFHLPQQLEFWGWESRRLQTWCDGMDIPKKASTELHTH